jgi:hypothetical protein
LDVDSATVLTTTSSIQEILVAAGGAASKPYRQTPLDFIDNQGPSWLIDVQPHLKFRTWARRRPLARFTNDRFPVVGAGPNSILLFFANMIYASVHLIGWDFSFPTIIEQRLWRAASIAIVITTFIFWMCESYQDGVRLNRWNRWRRKLFPRQVEDIEASRPPTRFIPVWEVIIMTPVSFLYTLARIYLVVECFVGLRSLPSKVFDDIEWTKFIPHF